MSAFNLRSHPRVTVTPHVAGISFASDIAECFKKNVENFLAGKPLGDAVNWDQKY
jgi:phosphoglycerate dehydrogenase-like enzyme